MTYQDTLEKIEHIMNSYKGEIITTERMLYIRSRVKEIVDIAKSKKAIPLDTDFRVNFDGEKAFVTLFRSLEKDNRQLEFAGF